MVCHWLSRLLPALLLTAGACAKKSAELPSAQAADSVATPAKGEGQAGGGAGNNDDKTPPPGVDLTQLDEFERKVFFRVINKESSVCGKAHSLLYSAKNDPSCRRSLYAVKYVARLVDKAFTDSEITEAVERRYRTPAAKIDLSDAPVKGNPNAPVTLVEFADYECPHCKRVQPVLRQVLEEFGDDVKVAFKNYPLPSHPNARSAAEAAVAAQLQGKFWQYSDKIWANADSLTPAALETFAKDVGLDVGKWRKDFDSEAVKARVQRDRSEGGGLRINMTPTIFLNGKLYSDEKDVESLRDWINEELGR
jgi:protein-disulfide isomerase